MKHDQMRVVLAVVLSGLILIGWQMYFMPEQPKVVVQKDVVVKGKSVIVPVQQNTPVAKKVSGIKKLDLKYVDFKSSNGDMNIIIGNNLSVKGMKSTSEKYPFSKAIGESPLTIQVKNAGTYEDIFFELFNTGDTIIGKNDAYGINFLGKYNKNGIFEFTLNSISPRTYRFKFQAEGKKAGAMSKREFLFLAEDVERFEVGDDKFNGEGKIKWAGVDFEYHLFALVNTSGIPFVQKVWSFLPDPNNEELTKGVMTLDLIKPVTEYKAQIVYELKDYDNLKVLGSSLDLAVDFGFFGIIAVPILKSLKFFYKLVPNYGIAIILLTLVMRLLLFPLQQKSYKSMKKMQAFQPQINKLKEKYKDDPQRSQKETMALFKREGINPLGGCLPLLLQMPIFFAMYRVLYSSVELVGAPFMLQIQDLSAKDPYYILPVLLGAAMFAQQMLTPMTNMDATQAKLMKFGMPILFLFIMKDLASGLVLYIFVSTIFGLIQQVFVNKKTTAK